MPIVYAKTVTKYESNMIKNLVFVLNFGVQAVGSLVVAYVMNAIISEQNAE